jgi:hypothetical protein
MTGKDKRKSRQGIRHKGWQENARVQANKSTSVDKKRHKGETQKHVRKDTKAGKEK